MGYAISAVKSKEDVHEKMDTDHRRSTGMSHRGSSRGRLSVVSAHRKHEPPPDLGRHPHLWHQRKGGDYTRHLRCAPYLCPKRARPLFCLRVRHGPGPPVADGLHPPFGPGTPFRDLRRRFREGGPLFQVTHGRRHEQRDAGRICPPIPRLYQRDQRLSQNR